MHQKVENHKFKNTIEISGDCDFEILVLFEFGSRKSNVSKWYEFSCFQFFPGYWIFLIASERVNNLCDQICVLLVICQRLLYNETVLMKCITKFKPILNLMCLVCIYIFIYIQIKLHYVSLWVVVVVVTHPWLRVDHKLSHCISNYTWVVFLYT
jgi:hypothetical protein